MLLLVLVLVLGIALSPILPPLLLLLVVMYIASSMLRKYSANFDGTAIVGIYPD
jgi:hypothetical protein